MIENPWKFRKSSDIEMEVLFRRAENVWNEAIAARDKEWIAWGEETCPHFKDYPIKFAEAIKEKGVTVYRDGQRYTQKSACPLCWKERKKEINQ